MDSRYDFVIVGGGHNGMTLAAYLSKSGYSVCVLESRLEIGGAQENAEPRPGFRIDPHASVLYAGAAPGMEQLELWKYGYRMSYWSQYGMGLTSDNRAFMSGNRWTYKEAAETLRPFSERDADIWAGMMGFIFPHLKDILRSTFWTPPYPVDLDVEQKDLPWVKTWNEASGGALPASFFEGSLVDVADELFEFGGLKAMMGIGAWYSGAAPTWDGMAPQAMGSFLLNSYASGAPKGGMHTYAHAIARCAIAHGARVLVNCPVEEIVIQDGRARGVVLADGSAAAGKTIWADKAVVSAVDVQQTFENLVGPKHVGPGFMQNVKDISLKGGSLYVLHVVCRELPKFIGQAQEVVDQHGYPGSVLYPCDDWDSITKQMREVYSRKKTPTGPENIAPLPVLMPTTYDHTRAPDGYHVLSPIYIELPPPEYHVDGPEADNALKEQIKREMLDMLEGLAPNMTGDNIVEVYANTPRDSEFRNAGLVGGNWYATRHCEDQWWTQRPLPELSRYRTPVEDLYLCHQTSFPGGLCLMAVAYNLMHILIDDGKVEPADWWYPSPWHITDEGNRVPASQGGK
ncbi:MAG: NAD(P)/FAD-dependent oxidoreductase [Acidimicrobiia bacterium]|nr:NAD(P)/FAD-dependent oxidoreductase [Acidimicrobiia bacterium]